MKTYPIMLNLRDRLCVVVGAGEVGRRKARALSACGAKVRLVGAGAAEGGAERVEAAYDPSQLTGAAVVIAATDDAAVNARVAADARSAGALVNVVDRPEECDFFVPAIVGDGEVVVAVGTGGNAPALAAVLARSLAEKLPERVGEFALALGRTRGVARERIADPQRRRAILRRLAGPEGYNAFLQAGAEGLIEQLEDEAS